MGKKKANKNRTATPDKFTGEVLLVFSRNPYKGYNFRQVSKQLGVSDSAGRQLIAATMEKLTSQGEIIELQRGKYQLNPKKLAGRYESSLVSGKVDMKQTGKAYILTEGGGEDIFIAANNTNHALHGDTVKVRLFPQRKGRKTEGEIIEIVRRRQKQFVGVMQVSQKFAFLVPDSSFIHVDIFIPSENLNGAKNGQKAIARITEWPERSKNPFGEIIEVLGTPGNNEVEMNSILASFDFPLSFSKKAEHEVSLIPDAVPEEEICRRRDFRDVFTCTIDPFDAKDFDDALSLRKLENGHWEVGVHIADVSYFVKPGSVIDTEALERGTSIYLVDRVIPMLPEKLSNRVCSLWPGEPKLCYSAVFEMDDQARVRKEWFGRTVIHSDRRYNYEEVQAIIEGGKGDFREELMTLHRLSSKLREERFRKGSIAFRSNEVKFILDEQGKPLDAFVKEQKESNWLIEDFMLLANRKVAERIGKPRSNYTHPAFVYRIHDTPNPDKLADFVALVNKLGYKLRFDSKKNIADSFNKLFEEVAGKGEENMIETVAVRTMAKAVYSTYNIGHYGLSFDYYTHFTSPIRRYPDLMVHRLLERYLNGKPTVSQKEYEDLCDQASEAERRAVEAERASVKYKQAEFLQDKIGQEFKGLISGVSKWGIYVELDKTKCEGMVPLQYMQDDIYYLDEDTYRVIGHHHGKVYRLGDPVEVRVKSINLSKKQIDFEMLN